MGGKLLTDVPATGRPSPAAAAIIKQIEQFALTDLGGREDRLIRLRDCHHLIAAAYRAFVQVAAASYYASNPARSTPLQDLADVADLSPTTMQGHIARGLPLLPPGLRRRAQAVRDARVAHRRGKGASTP